MIKFERDGEITYFKDARAALEWLVENYNKGNDYDLLSDYCCCFPAWVNHRYCAMDILLDPDYYNYNDLYEMWEEEMMSDIDCGCFDELERVWEDEEYDDD